MSDFRSLGAPQQLVSALNDRGITSPTPIQAATLPDSLQGRDVLGRGRTGSGKTFAFLLPTAARLASAAGRAGTSSGSARRVPGRPRALVLAPTRELATQIAESFDPLAQATGLTWATIFGGVGQGPQVSALNRGVDVAIACPGRLLDLMGQGHVSLDGIEITVLDEADHMADMGFLPMVTQILDRIPRGGQRMLFSATLDGGVNGLVKKYLNKPVVHEADSAHSPVSAMDHHVLEVDGGNKVAVVGDLAAAPGKTMVFTRTKHGAKNLARRLRGLGVPAVELHGNLSQGARTRNMDAFHSGRVNVMVATDIAARGIHVDDVALVVHADPPVEHKAYLHRSGRTARAGAAGTVITIQTPEQRGEVNSLMRAAKITATRSGADSSVLHELAPGERVFVSRAEAEQLATPPTRLNSRSGSSTRGNARRGSRRFSSRGSGRGRSRRRSSTGRGSGKRRRSAAPAHAVEAGLPVLRRRLVLAASLRSPPVAAGAAEPRGSRASLTRGCGDERLESGVVLAISTMNQAGTVELGMPESQISPEPLSIFPSCSLNKDPAPFMRVLQSRDQVSVMTREDHEIEVLLFRCSYNP